METSIARISHFYNHICVAVLEVTGDLKVGDVVHILGYTTDFVQRVRSMEIEHHPVESVGSGSEVALSVVRPVHKGDVVFLVAGPEADQMLLDSQTTLETPL
jgi:hypothetical protein